MSTEETHEPLTPRGDVPLTPREFRRPWQQRFIELLAISANVTVSAQGAGISAQTAHKVHKTDEVFAEAWAEALDIAIERAELIARRRALEGEKRTITRTRRIRDENGKLVSEEVTTEEQVYISDTLLIFLLKAHRPEIYRERYEVRQKIDGNVKVEMDEIYRTPTRERMLELIRLARDLELPIIDHDPTNGSREIEGPNGDSPA